MATSVLNQYSFFTTIVLTLFVVRFRIDSYTGGTPCRFSVSAALSCSACLMSAPRKRHCFLMSMSSLPMLSGMRISRPSSSLAYIAKRVYYDQQLESQHGRK